MSRLPFGRTAHAVRGANARQAGRSFEAELEATHRAYAADGIAAIARAHPPVGGIPGALYYAGKGQVDFVGHVRGVPVAFDAKSEAGAASFKHGIDDYHELDFLLTWRAAGGVAFLLVYDRERDTVYLLDQLEALRAGETVPMRTHARGRSIAQPVVPSLHRTDSARALDTALGRPVWPWITILSLPIAA
jgi:penicillin-binding protein-related factor A (putative recombinase)